MDKNLFIISLLSPFHNNFLIYFSILIILFFIIVSVFLNLTFKLINNTLLMCYSFKIKLIFNFSFIIYFYFIFLISHWHLYIFTKETLLWILFFPLLHKIHYWIFFFLLLNVPCYLHRSEYYIKNVFYIHIKTFYGGLQ